MSRFAFPGAVLLAALAYLLATFYFTPTPVLRGSEPISDISYGVRADLASKYTAAQSGWGESWVYQPRQNAGMPTGIFLDTRSQAWLEWTRGLWKIAGVPPTRGFNLFVLVVHLLVPLAMGLAAFLFRLPRWTCLIASALGAMLWFFDGYLHWCWWSGMPDWALASVLVPLIFASAHRFFGEGKMKFGLLLIVATALALLSHLYIAFGITLPIAVLYASGLSKRPWRDHLILVILIGVGIGLALPAIALRHQFAHLSNESGTLGLGTLSHIVTDFLGLTSDTRVTGGIGLRLGFRALSIGAAIITLVLWKRDGDSRLRVFMSGLISLAAIAYLGGYLAGLGGIQPYRFVAPMILLSVFPAAALVDEIRKRKALADLPRVAIATLIIIALATIPRLVRDVVYFASVLAPKPEVLPKETPHISDIIGFGSIGYPRHRDYRHHTAPQVFKGVAKWLAKKDLSKGRILVEYWPLAEYLVSHTKAHVLGASRLRSRQHKNANLFERHADKDPAPDAIIAYLERYAVSLAIVNANPSPGEDFVERMADIPEVMKSVIKHRPFRILESQITPNYFQKGQGSLVASTNRIQVSATDPQTDIVLRFHWLNTLVCRPDCELKRHPIPGDSIGFIQVSAPHPVNFIIENGY